MRLKPIKHYRSPAYPAIAVAVLTAVGAAANGANLIVKGRPAAPKLPPAESKPMPMLGEVASPARSPQVANGEAIELRNTAFVSVVTLKEGLGVQVNRAAKQPVWTLKLGGAAVTLAPDRATAASKGRSLRLPAAPRMIIGVLYVPVRAVGQALGFSVSRRGSDIALNSPTNHKMLILRTAAEKPVLVPGMPTLPEILRRSRKGS